VSGAMLDKLLLPRCCWEGNGSSKMVEDRRMRRDYPILGLSFRGVGEFKDVGWGDIESGLRLYHQRRFPNSYSL
jgi:hypothetical protein